MTVPALLQLSSLRAKMLLAFACLAALSGAAVVIGQGFLERVAGKVEVLAQNTTPLLVESLALVDNGRRMRATFEELLLADRDNLAAGRSRLAGLDAEARARLARLRSQSSALNIDLNLDVADESERGFLRGLLEVEQATRREKMDQSRLNASLETFSEAVAMLNIDLASVAKRIEGDISRTEDAAKVHVQTREASIESLGDVLSTILNEMNPALQSVYKLMAAGAHLRDITSSMIAQVSERERNSIEREAAQTLKSMRAASRKLAGRLRSEDGKAEHRRIESRLAAVEATLIGPEGLAVTKAEAMASSLWANEGRTLLTTLETTYFELLQKVRNGLEDLNSRTTVETSTEISRMRAVMATLVLLVTVVSMAFGFWFSRRITAPLQLLTDKVARVRANQAMEWPEHETIDDRSDEVGVLSRTFRSMVLELADARAELIARSESAIRTQFERLNAAMDNMSQGLCMFDPDLRLVVSNRRLAEIHQFGGTPAGGTHLQQLLELQTATAADEYAAGILVQDIVSAANAHRPSLSVFDRSDGRIISISQRPMPNGGSIVTHEDITERRQAEARIAHMAHHDHLTDLPNRAQLHNELGQALLHLETRKLGVLCLDLDHFKPVNDTLGHSIGDALLRAVADRLRGAVRDQEAIVARLGGDEFAILQIEAEQPVAATELAARIVEVITAPYEVGGHRIVIGASIGIAIADDDGHEPDQLLKNADLALYRAKEEGRGRYRFFEPEMDAKMQARRALELDLRRAVAMGELEVFYQPIINLSENRVSSFEALLRWDNDGKGPVPPSEFVPLAEEIGLINEIGRKVLKQACAEAASWPSDIRVAVNLSPVQFRSRAILLDVVSALASSGLEPKRLELEITEGVLLEGAADTLNILEQLHAIGVRISMDDFGTGYSSLSYLRQFPFDKIKIDRSFISDLADTDDSLAIVRAVTGLGKSLGMSTTAEGVETAEQLRQVMAEGCTEAQGYLFSEAARASEIAGLLARLNSSLHSAAA